MDCSRDEKECEEEMQTNLLDVPEPCRELILQYACRSQAFGTYASLCKTCYFDTRNRRLDHVKAVLVPYSYNMENVLIRIGKAAQRGLAQRLDDPHKILLFRSFDRYEKAAMPTLKRHFKGAILYSITELDMSSTLKESTKIFSSIPKAMARIVPNVRVLHLRNVDSSISAIVDFSKKCPRVEELDWSGSGNNGLPLDGADVLSRWPRLKVIFLDDVVLKDTREPDEVVPCPLLGKCHTKRLERVSLLRTTSSRLGVRDKTGGRPLKETWLLRLIERAPRLRWLRTDVLSPKAVQILKKVRPKLTIKTK